MRWFGIMSIMAGMVLSGCSHQQDDMRASLDKIRVMIKQSASLAVQAVCMDAKYRAEMVHAAAVLGRRAMGGSEMAKIHKMMNMQADANGNMDMKKNKDEGISREMKMHIDLHNAGEDVFDFLDDVDGKPGISCEQTVSASMAAAAAVLREAKGREPLAAAEKLDKNVATMLQDRKIPASVRALALALQRI